MRTIPEFAAPTPGGQGNRNASFRLEVIMRKWTAPRVIEIAVGMEINCYACATL